MTEVPPINSTELLSGETSLLAGRYRLVQQIGEGAAGTVYLAQDQLLDNREVAVKILHLAAANSEASLERLRREAEITQSLTHPGIVQVYSFDRISVGEDNRSTAVIVMEFVEGSTLRNIINQATLSEEEALRIFNQLVDALAFSHERGIIHRDIKPDNILVTSQGQVKLTDFGLAKFFDEREALTQTGQVLGTPGYMAPELYRGEEGSPASDVYSLGLILYEMLFGAQLQQSQNVFSSNEIKEANRIRRKLRWLKTQSSAIALLLNECCAPERADRPSSAVALRAQLNEVQSFADRARRFSRSRELVRLRRSVLRVAILLGLFLLMVLGYFGRVISPYSIEHHFTAKFFDKFQLRSTGGLLGIAPLDGDTYIRQRTSYGVENDRVARRLNERARQELLVCGIEHRIPNYAGALRAPFLGDGVAMVESCANYPLQAPLDRSSVKRVSPLMLAARFGDQALFSSILEATAADRIPAQVINQTYFEAIRMNRPEMVDELLRRQIRPEAIADETLIEVLLGPSERIFRTLLDADLKFVLHPSYIADRVARRLTVPLTRWKHTYARRAEVAKRRLAALSAKGHEFSNLKAQLTQEQLLSIAVEHPDLAAILWGLGVDWNFRSADGAVLLIEVLLNRKNPLADLLLSDGAVDLEAHDKNGRSPLSAAIISWHPGHLGDLLRRGVDPNAPTVVTVDEPPSPSLEPLVLGNFSGMVAQLLRDPRTNVEIELSQGATPLVYSATVTSTRIMEMLLAQGANPNFFFVRTPLVEAAITGRAAHVKLLLAHGADVNGTGADGTPPLTMAANRANDPELPQIIRMLLDAGADPFIRNNFGVDAFDQALVLPNSRAIGVLLNAIKLDPNRALPDGIKLFKSAVARGGWHAGAAELLKHEAVLKKDEGLIATVDQLQLLATSIPDLFRLPRDENRSLFDAVLQGDVYAVRTRVARGEDPMQWKGKNSPLNAAITRRDREVIRALVNTRPIDLNRVGIGEQSPLQVAAYNGDVDVIELLLSKGADPYRRDENGLTAHVNAYSSLKRDVWNLFQRVAPGSVAKLTENRYTERDFKKIFGELK